MDGNTWDAFLQTVATALRHAGIYVANGGLVTLYWLSAHLAQLGALALLTAMGVLDYTEAQRLNPTLHARGNWWALGLRYTLLTAEELETVTAMLEPETALPPVRFFETQPFNSVDEVEAVLGAENYTRAMEVQIPDGPKLIVLVDDAESPYRIRQIDYMPDGPDGQPANEKLAQILLAQMLSVQQQANAIDSDGRLAPSTAPEPGEEELSVMDFALARDDHDPEQVLAPELARVNLPVNSSRIETVIFASVKNQTQDKENAYVELGDGTRLKLHIHAGATNEHSYVGLGLAELPDGGLVLICFISTSGSPQDKDPRLAALAPLNTGWVTVEMGALHPDYIARHYYVIGTASNPPIVTQDIRQIRPANRASYLKEITPKVVGQR